MRSSPTVDIRGFGRSFGDVPVLSGVDLTIVPGEFVALLGRSGSGKSTLLRALSGLDAVQQGTVVTPSRNAVVFQEPRLLPWKRVLDNVILGLDRPDAAALGRKALEEVGLGKLMQAYPATLSGGEAQRASLARALVQEPELLLLDEPLGALDALTRLRMQQMIEDLWRRHGPAVLLVTHDVEEAVLLADRALVLADGRISTEIVIDLPRPRHLEQPGFLDIRRRLLSALGVELSPLPAAAPGATS
jgi:sulfonate transport system ATP-binding protein